MLHLYSLWKDYLLLSCHCIGKFSVNPSTVKKTNIRLEPEAKETRKIKVRTTILGNYSETLKRYKLTMLA